MAVSIDPQESNMHLVAVGNNEVFAEGSVAGTLAQVAGLAVDTSDNLNMFSGLQKAFIVNGTNFKIVDFSNTKLTVNALTTAPTRGSTVTQLTSGATMIVDFVNTAKTKIYGFTTSGTFVTTGGYTLSGGGMDPTTEVPSAVDEASTAPHGYDWTVYPGGASGSLPAKAYLGCWYRGRAVISGNPNDPHQWYMSRQLHPFDFAYVAGDAQSPVAGTNASAGKVGDIVRALIPFHDDFMIFGCASSMHYLQGDPAVGGELHSVDDFSGIFGAHSWCFDKKGDLYVFGADGLSRIRKGTMFLENLSTLSLPTLVKDEAANPETHRITLGYDFGRDAVQICITLLSDGSNSDYYFDIKGMGFFPETYPNECGVYSQLYYPSNVAANSDLLYGCKDGYIRKFDDSKKDDDIGASDQLISSNVLMPIRDLDEEDGDGKGRMNSLTLETSGGGSGGTFTDTDGVTLDVHVGDNAETLVEKVRDGDTPIITRTYSGPGRQKRLRDKASGKWLGIVLKNSTVSESWSLSKLSINSKLAGRIK
ncbi:MAG TPA: hypothetical protein ENI05_00445 [Porticoccus sp.]|nr:hypothetical protein [Porticoccus sp.]